jgi:hypothetical protein
MKPAAIALLAGLVLSVAVYADPAQESLAAEAQVITRDFMGSLKGELQRAIAAGGPVLAIDVCNKVAPSIAMHQAQKHGWDKVGRTSLKLRNPDNVPDAWEKGVLEQFEKRKAAGEPVETLTFSEVVSSQGQKAFRFMKAIPTGKVCLNCHGSDLDPSVAAKIDALYPQDRARGFEQGDIRGAFTLVKQF